MSIQLHAHILHVDGSVTHETAVLPRYRCLLSAVVTFGSRARRNDPTVAAVKTDETGSLYTWVGNYTPEHAQAFASWQLSDL